MHSRTSWILCDGTGRAWAAALDSMLYDLVDPDPNTTTPEWFKCERDCAKVLRSRGMDVVRHAASAKFRF